MGSIPNVALIKSDLMPAWFAVVFCPFRATILMRIVTQGDALGWNISALQADPDPGPSGESQSESVWRIAIQAIVDSVQAIDDPRPTSGLKGHNITAPGNVLGIDPE